MVLVSKKETIQIKRSNQNTGILVGWLVPGNVPARCGHFETLQ